MPLAGMEIQAFTPAAKAIRDFAAAGLYLEVAPAGGKWWRFKYRFGGKEKRMALGIYPRVTLKPTRYPGNDAPALLLQRIDPSEA